MRVLLVSMPDTVSAFDGLVEYPNIGLCSIAGNLNGCEVKVLDLVAFRRTITKTLVTQLDDFQPQLVGLSAMTFQYHTAVKVAAVIKGWDPEVTVVLGGYHGSLCHREIENSPEADLFDYIVRGEGEYAFSQLCSMLESRSPDFSGVQNLSYKQDDIFIHNPLGSLADLTTLKKPNRKARIFNDFFFFGLPFDCIETSRGCVMDCNFCSITKMYGRTFRTFPLESILMQLDELKTAGKRGVFFVDDNITLDIRRLKRLCEAIISEGFSTLHFIMQASVDGIAKDPHLAPLLARAGFRIVFLGIESGNQRNLDTLKKGYIAAKTKQVVRSLHDQGIAVVGGFIIGNPEDRPSDIWDVFRFAREIGVDHSIVQCLTPYPETEIRKSLQRRGFITNEYDYKLYNGFIVNVKTDYMNPLSVARELVKAGVVYYNNPIPMAKSLLWQYARSSFLKFLRVNGRFIRSGWKNRLFESTHRF
jgi:radical SAM superfamily enzyme YgiQ (UPF0313 family)